MNTFATLTLAAIVSLTAVIPAIAQTPQAAPAAVRPSATSRAVEPPGPPVPLGPYAEVTIETAEGLPTHTVYRPSNLSAFPAKDKLPIVVWGNGACRLDGLMYERYLTKIASHGFLVVVVGRRTFVSRPRRLRPRRLLQPLLRTGAWSGSRAATGWRWWHRRPPDSGHRLEYQREHAHRQRAGGKIDTETVAMMGQSCGGLMAIEAAHDPRVDTLVIWNSGVFNTGMASLTTATKATLATIHSNTAYFNGGVSDIAFENSNDDVSRINQVPVFYGVMKEAGHAATYAHVNGGKFAEVGANWLLWRLKGDRKAGAMFDGPDCGLCKDPAWTVQKKVGMPVRFAGGGAALVTVPRGPAPVGWGAAAFRATVVAQAPPRDALPDWIEAGKGGRLAAEMTFANPEGRLGVLLSAGAIDTQGHPFFTPLGSNGRACVTCHQPANAMSLSVAALRQRWRRDRRPRSGVRGDRRVQQPEPATRQRELPLAAAQSRTHPRGLAVAAAAHCRTRRSRQSSRLKSSAIRPASTSTPPTASRAGSPPSRCSAGRGRSPT